MKLSCATATNADAASIAVLRTAVAERLTQDFSKGHWSSRATERGVLVAIRTSRVLVFRRRSKVIATLTLATKKPWAIDKSYFAPSKRPLYLTNMAVRPDLQR